MGVSVFPDFFREISIHAPRAGSDYNVRNVNTSGALFQSTLPVRGATFWTIAGTPELTLFQSTLPVRGATVEGGEKYYIRKISIHAPRAGSDCIPVP